MKKIFPLCIVVFCIFSSTFITSQTFANYLALRNTGVTYNSINTPGFAFATWRNTGSFSQDDNRSDFQDIGFDFWYNGVRYTRFCVSTNGFLDFSSSTDNGGPTADDFGYQNTAFTNSNPAMSTNPAIAPFYDDLTAQGGVNPLGTSIKYYLTGAAPNRTLTVEWINMAVYLNTTPSLNFQVQLIETSGIIKINYGTMVQGTHSFSYSMGMNGITLSATPTAAQLKMLQTVNSNSFSNAIQNNLSAMPATNSQYVFTPPTPANPSGSLTFSGVGSNSLALNWPNWASNEVGYVIYKTDDGLNYNFVTQTAVNATSVAVTGLLASTTYTFKVHAVTEGWLSGALTGTQTTLSNSNKISRTSGNWSSATTWTPNGVPALGEDVTIADGHVVTVNVNGTCNNLYIGQTGTARLEFSGNTGRQLTVYNNITINSASSFSAQTSSTATHTVVAKRNIINNGIINFDVDNDTKIRLLFNKDGNQTVSGTGSLNKFYTIGYDMGTSINNILEFTCSNFSAANGYLLPANGTFKLSSANASNTTPFTAYTTLSRTSGIWLNSPNAVLNTSAGLELIGKITISNGTLNIGGSNSDILSSGGSIVINNGALNIGGKYYNTGINNLSFFTITGGTVTVPSSLSNNSTTEAPFHITGVGSQFTQTGGKIIIPREGGTGAQNLGYTNIGSIGGTVSGGTLQIGNSTTPANQIMYINTNFPIGQLNVESANATASVVTNPLSIIKDVNISTGSLRTSSLNITLGGNWFDAGTFVPGTASVIFNSNSNQSIFKSGGETFNSLVFSGSGTKTFSCPITASANVTINSGAPVDVGSNNYQLSLRGNFSNNGNFIARNGLVLLNGIASQNIGGSSTTNFYDLTLNNTAGAVLSSGQNIIRTLNLNNGTFSTNSNSLVLVSTATNSARISQITGSGNIIGNVTVQRYAKGGSTGWTLIGAPITSALSYNDWDDDIFISCPTCPDGSASGFLSIYTYDETVTGSYDNPASYIPINTINDPINPNTGYWVYLGTGSLTTTDITLDVAGSVGKFTTPITLKYTNTGSSSDDGWNLISNPYPSPIRWSLLKGATANIDNAVYAYNPDLNAGSGGHATYVNGISSPAVGAGGIGDTIPICQGFYVHSTGALSLTALESNKVGGNPTFLKLNSNAIAAPSIPLLRLNLKSAWGHDDESVLYFQAGATDNFDNDYDAYKLRGQDPFAPIIALEKGTDMFQVNGINPINGNFSMPLKTLTGYAGTYTITAQNIGSFPTGACINLYDVFTNTTTNLKTNNYVFNLADTTSVARFRLNISLTPLTINSNVSQPNCQYPNNGEITAIGTNSGPWNYFWKNSVGSIIKTSLNKSGMDTLNNLSSSGYSVEVNTVGMCDNNTTGFTINQVLFPNAQYTSVDTTYMSIGGLVNFNNTSANASSYFWDFGDALGFSTAIHPSYNYGSTGIFKAKLISTSSSGCNDTISKNIVVLNNISTGISSFNSSPNLIVKTIRDNEYIIEKRLTAEEEVNFKLLDPLGRLIYDFGKYSDRFISLPINLKGYNQGIYFLNIGTSEAIEVVKLPVK